MGRSVNRVLCFFSKWVAEVVRQPFLMLSLIAGPFVILLAFGAGAELGGTRPKTIVVSPEGSGDEPIEPLPHELDDELEVVGQTSNLAEAQEELRASEVQVVAVLPPDPVTAIEQGEHAPVVVYINEIDPIRNSYARAYLGDQIARLNQRAIEEAIGEAQTEAGDIDRLAGEASDAIAAIRAAREDIAQVEENVGRLQEILEPLTSTARELVDSSQAASSILPGLGGPLEEAEEVLATVERLQERVDDLQAQFGDESGSVVPSVEQLDAIQADIDRVDQTVDSAREVSAEVLSSPFELELHNVAPFEPSLMNFYAPAVLALLVQHLAVTLGALSMARVRLLGLTELLRVSPVRPTESVLGNYLSFGLFTALAGTLLILLLKYALGVPVFGQYTALAGGVVLLIVCSLGLGFVISMLSSSEQQAAQLAMLVLMASVFFSGLLFGLENLSWPVRALAYVLPATYAIDLFQDVMLRGVVQAPVDLFMLGAAGAVLFFLTLFLVKREFAPA